MSTIRSVQAIAPKYWATSLRSPVVAALSHPWVASIVRLDAVEEALRSLHPLLSLTQVRARVVKVVDETPSTKTFVLQPNAVWAGAQAGQFVRVQVEIDGRRMERAYSLSSRTGAHRLAITVKRQQGGLVSGYLHDAIKVGDVLTLSQAHGEFVLPSVLPPKILLLSAGSGITPVMAMLRDLQARNYQGDLVFVYVCRNQAERIFARQLESIVAHYPELSLLVHCDDDAGLFTPHALALAVPDLNDRSTWMCGPAGFMDAVQSHWDAQSLTAPLYSERFVAAPLLPARELGSAVHVALAASGRSFTTQGAEPLLVQAERAGLAPKHGCRMGICRSCQCTKLHGTVENLQTGEVSSALDEPIRLCITAARTDLVLDL